MGNPQSLETGTVTDYQVVIFILIPGVLASEQHLLLRSTERRRPDTDEAKTNPTDGGEIPKTPRGSRYDSRDSPPQHLFIK